MGSGASATDDLTGKTREDRRFKQGLLHKSRLSATGRVENVSDMVTVGEEMFVKVVEITEEGGAPPSSAADNSTGSTKKVRRGHPFRAASNGQRFRPGQCRI